MKKKKLKDEPIKELQKKRKVSEAEAKAELIYWATGRTNVYPKKDFTKNYNEIKARSEKKREMKNISTRF